MVTHVARLEQKWRRIGERTHNGTFEGRTHLLFANELRAAMMLDALDAPDANPDRHKLIVSEGVARAMEAAGLPITQIKIAEPMPLSDLEGYPKPPTDTEESLVAEYEAYTKAQGLPNHCAEELIHGFLLPAQRQWITSFILRWEAYFADVSRANRLALA